MSGFFDLPWDVRHLIYKQIFEGSAVDQVAATKIELPLWNAEDKHNMRMSSMDPDRPSCFFYLVPPVDGHLNFMLSCRRVFNEFRESTRLEKDWRVRISLLLSKDRPFTAMIHWLAPNDLRREVEIKDQIEIEQVASTSQRVESATAAEYSKRRKRRRVESEADMCPTRLRNLTVEILLLKSLGVDMGMRLVVPNMFLLLNLLIYRGPNIAAQSQLPYRLQIDNLSLEMSMLSEGDSLPARTKLSTEVIQPQIEYFIAKGLFTNHIERFYLRLVQNGDLTEEAVVLEVRTRDLSRKLKDEPKWPVCNWSTKIDVNHHRDGIQFSLWRGLPVLGASDDFWHELIEKNRLRALGTKVDDLQGALSPKSI